MIKHSEMMEILKDYPDDREVFCNLRDNIQIH